MWGGPRRPGPCDGGGKEEGEATQLYGFTYEFDAAGNRTKKIDTNPATPVTTYYTYNSLNLMTKEFTQ